MDYVLRMAILVSIPVIVRCVTRTRKKSISENYDTLKFPFYFRIIGYIVMPLFIYIVVADYYKNGIIDAMIDSILLVSDIFATLYLSMTRIRIYNNCDYFEYRNMFLFTKKIYYEKIINVQKIKNSLHILLDDKKKILIDLSIENIDVLFAQFRLNRVSILKEKVK